MTAGGRYERSGDSVLDAALNGCGDGSLDRSVEAHDARFSSETSF